MLADRGGGVRLPLPVLGYFGGRSLLRGCYLLMQGSDSVITRPLDVRDLLPSGDVPRGRCGDSLFPFASGIAAITDQRSRASNSFGGFW
ncbi:hypothetical protein ACIHDR_23780 [Nocardia sp. NPDC052278]|uniref:hypothetical protein n=1 Tax=unclassified Nocardia TaxID=2637762 RepID=UPI0036BC3FDD